MSTGLATGLFEGGGRGQALQPIRIESRNWCADSGASAEIIVIILWIRECPVPHPLVLLGAGGRLLQWRIRRVKEFADAPDGRGLPADAGPESGGEAGGLLCL